MYSIRACGVIGVTLALQASLITSSISVELAAEAAPPPETIAERYGRLPIAFERNAGQTDPRVQFLAHGRGYTLFLTGPDAMVKVGTDRAAAAVRMTLVGAARQASATAIDELPGVTNYFMDADPGKWRTSVRSYARVRYSQIYPGIDLIYYGNQSQLEYDFIVAPRADPSKIVLDLDGADRLELDPRGQLLAHVAGGRIELKKPVAYQEVDGVRTDVPIRYAIRVNRVHLRIAPYDKRLPLIVDPVLSYSSRLGGSGTDLPGDIAVDSQGSAHLTGTTMSPDFPATTGTLNGSAMFVTKMNPAGTAVVYSALFPAIGSAVAVDAAGNAYATGTTGIRDFPTTPGAYRRVGAVNMDNEGIALKLDPAGAVVYSTYLPFHDSQRTASIAVDTSGNVIVGGDYFAATGPGAFAGNGGLVTKLNATGTAVVYATNVAAETPTGPGQPQRHVTGVFSVAVDADGGAYATGLTTSPFLVTTAGAYQRTFHGPDLGLDTLPDGFVVKLDATGTVIYSTYLGTSDSESGNGIAVDASHNAYVTGYTSSNSFPVTPGAYQTTSKGGYDAFVAKLNPIGSALVYSTLLGGSGTDTGDGIAVDAFGYAYVGGTTGSPNFPTTANARQTTFGGGSEDAFVARLNPAGSRLGYSTFFGGSGTDQTRSMAIDALGGVYVTGLMPGGASDIDAFILKLHLFNGRGTTANFDGDRRTDLAVYRPSIGTWYVRRSSAGFSTATEISWGLPSDVAVPGDYDGDGTTDIAVYRPSTGAWYILQSSANFTASVILAFGGAGDTPVPGDYDGDGRTDAAVFHPATGVWSIRSSASGDTLIPIALGRASDVPVPGDYDGDGKTDAAVYRPSTGTWTIRRSSAANTTSFIVAWGLAGDVPVPGDYDGDGLTDPAVYRPAGGEWYVLHSHSGYGTSVTRQWGLSGDTAVPGDYDGDGTFDLAVYRPVNGGWYILESGTNFTTSAFFSWGLAGDVPAPAAVLSNSRTIAASKTALSPAVNLARYGDFDGDGRADITIYRPSQSAFYTRPSTGQPFTIYWSGGTGVPAAADFDGDGVTDFAVYSSTGDWNIRLSTTPFPQTLALTWGASGDVPAPADFDGDGRAEIAVYRPSTGQWFIRWSRANYTTHAMIAWGLSGDIPVAGDYDGDGLDDVAVFRPATGEWLILQSHSNYTTSATLAWGLNGDVPVPGDYDGDGQTDVAVYRPVSGQWYILKSSSGFTANAVFSFGLNGDRPVPADYDGDGLTDLAVHRPASGVWYILRSQSGFTTSVEQQWGLPGDVALPKRR